MGKPRIFKTKWFRRFARKEGIEDAVLVEAVPRAEKGQIDANLAGGVIKQRIARRDREGREDIHSLSAGRSRGVYVRLREKRERQHPCR